MDITALMLADSRFPGGGHAHSGGVEEAASRGLVSTEDDLPVFLLGRLRTAGELAAAFAAAAAYAVRHRAAEGFWAALDAELDARTPSPAQRAASRAQGAGCVRVLAALPSVNIYDKCKLGDRPHHCLAVGAVIGCGGGSPGDAAYVLAYLSVTGPATAAVRLLGLDPLVVNGIVLELGPEIAAVAERAAAGAALEPSELPAPGSPGLDLLAEAHKRAEVRLFAS